LLRRYRYWIHVASNITRPSRTTTSQCKLTSNVAALSSTAFPLFPRSVGHVGGSAFVVFKYGRMGSSLSTEINQPKKNKKTVRSLASWWKKKRSFYVDIPHDDSFAVQTQDVTMADVDSDHGVNLNVGMHDTTSVTSSPTFDVTAEYSPDKSKHPWDSEEQATLLPSVKDQLASLESASPVERPGHHAPERRSPVTMPFVQEDEPFLSRPVPFTRKSFSSGSLESMDSLDESYWDSDDSDRGELPPHWTPVAGDCGYMDFCPDFFAEHVQYLRARTSTVAPHQIVEIWSLSEGEAWG
jgi:hypothetical protein